jgi:putative ABC transport system substrate-binding protein
MRRREFTTLLGGAVASWPLVARAQQPAMPVIGYFRSTDSSAPYLAGFLRGLKENGYVEGQNVAIEYRFAEGQYDRLSTLATDLVRSRVAVIHATDNAAALAAKTATATTPIVFAIGGDPVRMGLVASLNQPGGNITGVSFLATDTVAKMLEVLHKMVPSASVIAALVNPANPNSDTDAKEAQKAAHLLGLQLQVLSVRNEQEIGLAFASLVELRVGALVIEGDPLFAGSRLSLGSQIIAQAARHAIPAIYQASSFADAGGLMSYGSNVEDLFRKVGIYAGRILKGEKPADMPVQQATKFELVINLKTAKALGLTIPPTLLARADEVIE